VIDLVEGGRKIAEVSKELGVSQQTIYVWRRQARIDAGLEALAVERSWERRQWSQGQSGALARAANFDAPTYLAPTGGGAGPDAAVFVALVRRP